ncbi:C2 calcium-dependent membrane targeting [Penicillium camemberti]|uniref:C2 calcium-dependent membrane targeting n=1 Tax=Penicillium camemberti (strain FM 013) TaxID=1429867 RepID=A0A0G4PRZ9_PENC3|nr:C2 calcium-dependent membrane targeting [Penicillium camemberti]
MDDSQPRSLPVHPIDKYGPKFVEKADKIHRRVTMNDESKPAGGFDDTPIPHAPPGYTLKITFHRAEDLPVADFGSFSSDPYVSAHMIVDLPTRHKQDPDLRFRTPTIRKDMNPKWECEWIVANVPASGFQLKCHLMDEDPADHDDKLGIASIDVPALSEDWAGFKEKSFKVKKRFGSKRVYVFTNVSAFATGHRKESWLVASIECLGKTPGTEGGQVYTIGPNHWFKHFSPLIGRLAGIKDQVQSKDGSGKSISRYNFQAIQMQLTGPIPAELYHRYVEFRPFVAGMFQAQSLRGRILHKALHHQHQRIYNFDRTTLHGSFQTPCRELAQKFLEFAHYGQGGRIFTYVLTLDGQLRFTETGKEFGIDMLSKHTMHSDVSIYIAYSGEFFLRRRKHRHRRNSPEGRAERAENAENAEHAESSTVPTDEFPVEEDEDHNEGEDLDQTEEGIPISTNPADYELFIDNDSGTYRPNAEKLPLLREFISSNFPGLHVTTLDCQADAERMGNLKNEQREFKKNAGNVITFLQQSSTSSLSISSSDEDELNERSGQSKQRGDLSRRVHEMRDLRGQVMRWVEADEKPDGHKHKHRYFSTRERPVSTGAITTDPKNGTSQLAT